MRNRDDEAVCGQGRYDFGRLAQLVRVLASHASVMAGSQSINPNVSWMRSVYLFSGGELVQSAEGLG